MRVICLARLGTAQPDGRVLFDGDSTPVAGARVVRMGLAGDTDKNGQTIRSGDRVRDGRGRVGKIDEIRENGIFVEWETGGASWVSPDTLEKI